MKINDAPANSGRSGKEIKNRDSRKLADKIGPVDKNRLAKDQPIDSKKEKFFNKVDKKKNRDN